LGKEIKGNHRGIKGVDIPPVGGGVEKFVGIEKNRQKTDCHSGCAGSIKQ